jgi:hypothetical protein
MVALESIVDIHAAALAASFASIQPRTSDRKKAMRFSPRATATGNRPSDRSRWIMVFDMDVSAHVSRREIRA